MVALVVVLHDHLPVRPNGVGVGGHGLEALGLPRRDQLLQVPDPFREVRRLPRGVREHEAAPLGDPGRDQRVARPVEAGHLGEPRRAQEPPVEAVGPGVVGAPDHPQVAGVAAGQELVAAVPAGVEEPAQGPVLAPDHEHPVPAHPEGGLVPGPRKGLGPAQAHPAPPEQVLLLPGEHLG